MRSPPKNVGGANVLLWAVLDESVVPTAFCTHSVCGSPIDTVAGLAICVYSDQLVLGQYYLFHCDELWEVLADTCHDTLELAQRQAEAEYRGVTSLWRSRF